MLSIVSVDLLEPTQGQAGIINHERVPGVEGWGGFAVYRLGIAYSDLG
jgi:hypothetical protein